MANMYPMGSDADWGFDPEVLAAVRAAQASASQTGPVDNYNGTGYAADGTATTLSGDPYASAGYGAATPDAYTGQFGAGTPGSGVVLPPAGAGGAGGAATPPTMFLPPGTQPGGPALTPMAGNNPDALGFAANQQLLAAQQAQILAQGKALSLQPGADAIKREQYATQEEYNAAQSAYLAEQTRALQAKQAEEAALQGAKADTGNILSVAKMQRTRDSLTYRYSLAGLPAPIEVVLPPDFQGPIPAGVLQRLQTLAEILADKAQDAEAMRQFTLEAARIKSQTLQLKVSAADIKAGKYNLELAEAELAADRAGLMVNQARLDLAKSQMPPAPGYEWDDVGQQWLPKSQLDALNDTRKLQEGGTYGVFSYEAMSEMVVRGTMDVNTMQQALLQKGYLPATVDAMVNLALARKAASEQSDTAGIDPALIQLLQGLELG